MFKKVFYGWWVVLACFIISLYVGGVAFFGFTAFFHPIREELGWSYTQISFASSLRGMEMGIFAPVLGFFVDRLGSRRLVLAGTVMIGIGLIVLSLTQSLVTFYGAFLLIGFGAGGCTSVVTMTAVANWFHKNVGLALGVMASGFGASGLIVPVIVRLIDIYGWRTTLVFLGVGMWILGIPFSLFIRDRPEPYGYLPDGEAPDALPGVGGALKEKPEPISPGFREVLKTRGFLYVNLVEALRLMTVTAVVIHIMPYLENMGLQRTLAGVVAAAVPLVSIIGRIGFGRLSDAFEKRHVMAVTFLMMGLGLLALCYVQWTAGVFLFLLFFPPGLGGSMVLRGAILRDYFGRASFGKMIGTVMGAGSVGGIIGPTLAGWAFDTLGSYRWVWLFVSVLTFIASVVVLRIKPSRESGST
jgi:MFS family permease